ncbi:serine/threonine protein kinase [Candidatus Uabimicrobium sp. HlEnr_7]|uniref:serine/threonine protein kinase n=1 Tax=Candidatus Uabimicrobium helgolandensis TaxID=3095367 RepID=UPI00355900D4
MLITIYHETNNKVFELDVSEETSLRKIYDSLIEKGEISRDSEVVFTWNKNILKWESTIQELQVFYNFVINEHQVHLKEVKKTKKRNTLGTSEIFAFLQKTLDEKNKSWHKGFLDPRIPHSQIPKINYIFAQRYQIITEIHTKSIIQTYKALDINEQRTIYLFVGHKSIVDYRLPISLDSVSVLRTYNVGEYENYSYSAVEYHPGQFLSDFILGEKQLSILQILTLFIKLANILTKVHKCEYMHGNLTTRDIVVCEQLSPCLIFSGLSYKVRPNSTTNGLPKLEFVEEPVYSSPEQVCNQRQSPLCDIFALGAILYHLVTKRAPFGCYKDRLIHDELISPENFAPSIPTGLSRFLKKMLAEDVDERPSSMKIVSENLCSVYRSILFDQIEIFLGAEHDFVGILRSLHKVDPEKADAVQEFIILCREKNVDLSFKIQTFLHAAIKKNEVLAIASFKNVDEDLRSVWIQEILYKVSLPASLISLIPTNKLNLLIENRDENIRRRITRTLLFFPANISLLHILNIVESSNQQNKEYLQKYLQTNKEQILAPLFILLFENKKRKLKLIHQILVDLNFTVIVDAVTSLKKGDDAPWQSMMKNLEQQPNLYFFVLASLNILLREKNRNIRWLAGHAFFLLGTGTLLQKYILLLKKENKIAYLLQIMNFAGNEIAHLVANLLRGSLDDNFLKYIWSLRWNPKDEERIITCQIFGKQKIARGIQFLIETLYSSNRSLRKEAENSIIQIGVAAVAELIPYISDEELQNPISNIFKSLGKEAVAPLTSFLERSDDLADKKSIIRILGIIGGEEAICTLLPYLSEEYKIIYDLVKHNMVIQKQQCEEWLLPALKGTTYIRQRVQEILVATKSEKAINSLFEDLKYCDRSIEQHILKLIVELENKVLEKFIENVALEQLIKLYCIVNKQETKKLLENYLHKRIENFYIFQQFLVSKTHTDLKMPEFFYALVCKLLELSPKLSVQCAQILASNFSVKSAPYLVKAWCDLWELHVSQLVLSGKLGVQDLKILPQPVNAVIYQECIIDIADDSVPHLVEKLQSASTAIGMKIIDLLGKIRTPYAIEQLKNILKNNNLDKFLRQFAHVTLCTVNNEIDLLIQFLQQQRGTYLGDETLHVLLEISITNTADVIISSIVKLNAQEIFEELFIEILHSHLESILFIPFLERCPKEILEPILLENLNKPSSQVSERAIEFLAICPSKQALNALQVLLMRKTKSEQSAIIEKSIAQMRESF